LIKKNNVVSNSLTHHLECSHYKKINDMNNVGGEATKRTKLKTIIKNSLRINNTFASQTANNEIPNHSYSVA